YIRRRTHNRNDQRTLMHLRHTEDNEEQQLIKKYPSINGNNICNRYCQIDNY
ncbi:MAG: hypothetical protein MHMPM18_004965, partial [Marteilia pararefringens]